MRDHEIVPYSLPDLSDGERIARAEASPTAKIAAWPRFNAPPNAWLATASRSDAARTSSKRSCSRASLTFAATYEAHE